MGFDEHGRNSMQSNRSLLRSTVHKYFRGEKRLAVNEKKELGLRHTKEAVAKERINILLGYLLFLIAFVVVVILISIFLF